MRSFSLKIPFLQSPCKEKGLQFTKNNYRINFVSPLFSSLDFQRKFLEKEIIMLFALKEKDQGMVEYALILVLVAVVVIAALTIMGPLVRNVFSTINSSL